jgi:hypothetical protein
MDDKGKEATDPQGSDDRRKAERRHSIEPIAGDDRREAERRSNEDRRKTPRES